MNNQVEILPEVVIKPNGPISKSCLHTGLVSYKQACQYVQDLAYCELNSEQNWQDTLTLKQGVSSTKHAFLKALANELDINIELILGIYAMTEQNTPGVGVILDKFRIQSIPEAHCYLKYQGTRLDFTRHFYDDDYIEPIASFLHEESVPPDNIQHYKIQVHQRIIKERFGKDRFDHIWTIRERCIAALEN